MENMRFRDTMMKVLDARKEGLARMVDQSATKAPGGASPEDIADYKKRMMEAWSTEMSPDGTLQDMIKVYAELFTADDLKVMAEFYQTPAGQALVAKTLELQQKSGAILANRMQAVTPKLQKINKEFMDAHPAKPAAVGVPSSPSPAPGSPPATPAAPSAPAP